MHYVVALVAVVGLVVFGSQLMLMVPEGWPVVAVAALTFLAAGWSARYIIRRGSRR